MSTPSDFYLNLDNFNGMSDIRVVMQNVFGSYTPSGDGFGGADWEYIFTVLIFVMIVYFFLSIVRGFFKKR